MNGRAVQRFCLTLMACLALATCSKNDSGKPFPPTGIAVLRLDGTTGALDPNFGGGGIVIIDPDAGQFDFANAVALQPNGQILSAGRIVSQGLNSIALIRQNTDGSLDTSFGSSGIVSTPIQGASASASAIAVQGDGKILVAAITFNQGLGTTNITLARYTSTGALDVTFNPASAFRGTVIAPLGPGQDSDTCGLVLQGTNIIVAGASTGGSSNGNVYLYRFDTNGILDTTFGTPPGTGVTITNLGAPAMSPAIALSGNKIVLVGGKGSFSGTSSPVQEIVARYSVDGVLDPTFGVTQPVPGIVTTDIDFRANFGSALLVQSDQKIVTVGHANVDFAADTSDISLVRYNTDGTLDSTFGPTQPVPGIVITDLGGFDNALSIALQPPLTGTQLIVAGNSGSHGLSRVAVLRYNADGSLDNTFGPTLMGVAAPPLVGPSITASGSAVVVQPDGNIVVAGYD
jgi:uncharacterized delta-60 repeat protein